MNKKVTGLYLFLISIIVISNCEKKQGKISWFITKQAWGEIGNVASMLHVGELGGPVRTAKNQVTIFKLIEKRAAGVIDYNEVKSSVQDWALQEKQ